MKKTLATLLLTTASLTSQARGLTDQIQELPYETLKPGVAQRWVDIKQKLQTGRDCPKGQYISWDYNGNILGYFPMPKKTSEGELLTKEQRQLVINQYRTKHKNPILATTKQIGYPFVANCEQESQSEIENGVTTYFETYLDGRWKTHNFPQKTNIRNIFRQIHNQMRQNGEITFPNNLFYYTLGQYVFEAGGVKKKKSKDGALGVMQIIPDNLKRVCKNPMLNPYHRIAQIECALRLHENHYQLLKPNFQKQFGHLSQSKQNELLSLLTLQGYHSGQNGINRLIGEESRIIQHLAKNHQEYSAADLHFMLMFHNYGKNKLKYQSLKYTINARSSLNELNMRAKSYAP